MNNIWPKFTKEQPCPACGHWDWSCRAGDYCFVCMREPSDHPTKDNGWYHPYAHRQKSFKLPKANVAPPLKDAFSMAAKIFEQTEQHDFDRLSALLNVSTESIQWLMAGYSLAYDAWSFPMSDGNGKTIGIRLRNEAGDKWAVKGSRQGLFIPNYFEGDDAWNDCCFVTEGPTDCAAILSLGLYSIGRPTCNSDPAQLATALRTHSIRRAVIICDNDDKRRPNGQQWSPGINGAVSLGKALRIPHVVWIPPTKDVREFVKSGGTKTVLLSAIKQMVWKR